MASDCALCPLGDYVRSIGGHVCVPADERKAGLSGVRTDMLVVGQNPGKVENGNGIPFTGESGKVRWYLDRLGYSYAITNAVKCHSPENREPLVGEEAACSSYLLGELRRYRPRIVVALGNSALHALTGHRGIAKARSVPQDLRAPFRLALGPDAPKVLCTVHPANALRYPSEWGKISEDLDAVARYLSPDKPAPVTWNRADYPLAQMSHQRVTYDLETSTANYRDPRYSLYLCGYKVMGSDQVEVARENVTKLRCLELVTAAHSNEIVSFNGLSFDEPALLSRMAWLGQKPMHYDVMLIAYLIDETMKVISLQYCATRWLGVAPWKEEGRQLWDKKTKLARMPATEEEWEGLERYNARDVTYTERLFDVLWPKLDTQQQRLYKYLMMPAARELSKMWENGLPISAENIAEAKIRCEAESLQAIREVIPYIKRFEFDGKFNMNSTQNIADLLYNRLKLPVLKRTPPPSRAPSTDQETLKRLAERGCEPVLCNAILKYRKYDKLESGTLNRYLGLIEEDGRAHLPYHLVRTETGRTSGPSQQIPRQPWLRRIVKSKPGYVLVSADQSQVELRTMAWRSREPTMLRVFRDGYMGGDIHSVTALTIVNLQRAERGEPPLETFDKVLYKEARDLAKPVNFGALYGAEWFTLQVQLFVDYDIVVSAKTCMWLRDNVFFGTYPGLTSYYDRRVLETIETGIVRSPFGRQRHLENINARDRDIAVESARKAINTDNQSDASDITLIGLMLARKEASWLEAIHFGHDCNVFHVPKDRVDEACAIIPKAMTDGTIDYIADHFGFMIDVPLQVDCKVSEEWS